MPAMPFHTARRMIPELVIPSHQNPPQPRVFIRVAGEGFDPSGWGKISLIYIYAGNKAGVVRKDRGRLA